MTHCNHHPQALICLDPVLNLHDEADERASSAVHIVAFLLAVSLLAFSVDLTPTDHALRRNVTLFAAFMVFMYLASALFHASPQGWLKQALERVDRAAIFLFIAASYSLFEIQEESGFSIAIWTLAFIGAATSILRPPQGVIRIVLPYVLLGWLAVGGIAWQARLMNDASLGLLLLGALVYTAGLTYYLAPRVRRFSHTAWHLFVAIGSAIHTAAAFV